VSTSALAFILSYMDRWEFFGLNYSFYVSYHAFDVGFHCWCDFKLQDKFFWDVIHKASLYDGVKIVFD
jgi:hypothetical protein